MVGDNVAGRVVRGVAGYGKGAGVALEKALQDRDPAVIDVGVAAAHPSLVHENLEIAPKSLWYLTINASIQWVLALV